MAPQLVLFSHISSSWVKIRLYTENQLTRLPGNTLKVLWWVGPYPLSSQTPTHVEVELGCDNLESLFKNKNNFTIV